MALVAMVIRGLFARLDCQGCAKRDKEEVGVCDGVGAGGAIVG